MRAVIMAGGRGSRLMPLTRTVPKPMVPLLDRPVMEYIVELLARHGFHEIDVTLGYLPDAIRRHFGDGRQFGVRMTYHVESIPLGTAGGVKRAASGFADAFLVMSADALTDMDLGQAMAAHRASGAWATLVLATVPCPLGYGVVDLSVDGFVEAFVEKPSTWTEGRLYTVNTGVYILEPSILAFIPDGEPYDFGRQLFPRLLEAGIPLYGHVAGGYWSDIGTLQQYYQSQLDMLHGRVQVRLPKEVRSLLTPNGERQTAG
ncbi:nucleotidyltransferase family protein [Alicyclobacillus sp.]|uniref:nucleotidyltransferase family protein n=1 Tax=Alicyclobacillus sp. TaxID=61169 RepID=UPI0025C46867|nr:nucleotidyltransferase family protein [Alicyclobacillus sp.]MCL6515563.1 nucleotidyltransferase family protein [Alicyclobacillus sp.]